MLDHTIYWKNTLYTVDAELAGHVHKLDVKMQSLCVCGFSLFTVRVVAKPYQFGVNWPTTLCENKDGYISLPSNLNASLNQIWMVWMVLNLNGFEWFFEWFWIWMNFEWFKFEWFWNLNGFELNGLNGFGLNFWMVWFEWFGLNWMVWIVLKWSWIEWFWMNFEWFWKMVLNSNLNGFELLTLQSVALFSDWRWIKNNPKRLEIKHV